MPKGLLVLIVGLTFFSLSASAQQPDLNKFGPCDFGKETMSSVLCVGPTKLLDTVIAGKITVAGPLEVTSANINSLEVAGEARLNESTVNANVLISGPLNSTHGDFEGDVLIESDKVMFNDTTVKGSLTIKSSEKNPIVELQCGSSISGKVIFIGKKGIIKKSADSEINGKITNGLVEESKVSNNCSEN